MSLRRSGLSAVLAAGTLACGTEKPASELPSVDGGASLDAGGEPRRRDATRSDDADGPSEPFDRSVEIEGASHVDGATEATAAPDAPSPPDGAGAPTDGRVDGEAPC